MLNLFRLLFVLAFVAAFVALASGCSEDTSPAPLAEPEYVPSPSTLSREVCQRAIESRFVEQGRGYDWNTRDHGEVLSRGEAVPERLRPVYEKFPGTEGWYIFTGSLTAENRYGGTSRHVAACVIKLATQELGTLIVAEAS